jgi:predicted SnoaL-like aldol condensation-catalyzing enzyme
MATTQSQNKALVLQAFDTLFNKRDYAAAESFWSPAHIQHSAHIAPGRDGLFELVSAAPKELRYETALIVADGDYVQLSFPSQPHLDRLGRLGGRPFRGVPPVPMA